MILYQDTKTPPSRAGFAKEKPTRGSPRSNAKANVCPGNGHDARITLGSVFVAILDHTILDVLDRTRNAPALDKNPELPLIIPDRVNIVHRIIDDHPAAGTVRERVVQPHPVNPAVLFCVHSHSLDDGLVPVDGLLAIFEPVGAVAAHLFYRGEKQQFFKGGTEFGALRRCHA